MQIQDRVRQIMESRARRKEQERPQIISIMGGLYAGFKKCEQELISLKDFNNITSLNQAFKMKIQSCYDKMKIEADFCADKQKNLLILLEDKAKKNINIIAERGMEKDSSLEQTLCEEKKESLQEAEQFVQEMKNEILRLEVEGIRKKLLNEMGMTSH
ncbi:MAG: hypothetical protein GY820_04920 [Gammaproteobacteria bacterium]|nr:hypothetical protein [Gammaproteobacteria bacterium]